MDAMSENPQEDTPAPAGIDHQLDSGIADQDHQGDDADTDLQSGPGTRTDPDDPEAGMEASARKAHEPTE